MRCGLAVHVGKGKNGPMKRAKHMNQHSYHILCNDISKGVTDYRRLHSFRNQASPSAALVIESASQV